MTTRDEAIQKAIDTLAELCDPVPYIEEESDRYEVRERTDTRRRSAEQILDHYREQDTMQALKTLAIELTINGAIPVRPMTKAEVQR